MDHLKQIGMSVFLYNRLYHSDPGPEDIFCGNIRIHSLKDLLIQISFPCKKQNLLYFVFLYISVNPLTESHNINSRINKTYLIVWAVLSETAVKLCINDSPVGRSCQPGHISGAEDISCFVYILIEPCVQAFFSRSFYIGNLIVSNMDDPAGILFFQKIIQASISFGTVIITRD